MVHIKEGTLEKIKNWNDDSIYILADFDRTLTTNDSDGSAAVLSKIDSVPEEYIFEKQKAYDYYRPIELDETLDHETKSRLMSDWWEKEIKLFTEHQLSERDINESTEILTKISLRPGTRQFLENMNKKNIPVIIISAGIGNIIEQFLIKNNCNFDNINIVSNFIKFENGFASGYLNEPIHSLNKNEVTLSEKIQSTINNRPNIILLGDLIADIEMIPKDKINSALKIGFLEDKIEENRPYYKEKFDVVLEKNGSFDKLANILQILN